MNVAYINPFLSATKDVFQTMIKIPLTLGKPRLKDRAEPSYAVSASIGISGSVTGTVVISFPQDVAIDVASGLAGTPLKALDQDCVDALGEVANMIAGSAKGRLTGGPNSLSLPNVVLGQHRVAFPTGVPIIVIPCDTPSGQFAIEIGFRDNSPK
jgi:chemotaxis protein CheX